MSSRVILPNQEVSDNNGAFAAPAKAQDEAEVEELYRFFTTELPADIQRSAILAVAGNRRRILVQEHVWIKGADGSLLLTAAAHVVGLSSRAFADEFISEGYEILERNIAKALCIDEMRQLYRLNTAWHSLDQWEVLALRIRLAEYAVENRIWACNPEVHGKWYQPLLEIYLNAVQDHDASG